MDVPLGSHLPACIHLASQVGEEKGSGSIMACSSLAVGQASRHLVSDNGKCRRLDFLIRLQRAIKLLCKYGQAGVHVLAVREGKQRGGGGRAASVKEYAH